MDNTIDYGQWTVPASWDEINLKMFEEIERYYDDKDKKFDVREVLHIFTNKTMDEINALPIELTEKLLEKLSFLDKPHAQYEPTYKIKIDGVEYIINVMEKLKTGEYIAVDTILKADKHDYASILAVICRKEGEIYDSKYEAEEFENRKKMFEEQPITSILPIVAFFLNLSIALRMPTLLSLEVQEGLNHIRENIKSSRENGELSARYTKRLMKKLKKLEKSINSI